MLNNQIIQLIGQLRGSRNPQMLMNQMLGNNPNFQRAMQMANGKDQNQLQQVAQNLCDQKGINLNDFINHLGLR